MGQRILGLFELSLVQCSSCNKSLCFCSRKLMGRNCKGTVSASGSELLGYRECVKEGFCGFRKGFVVLS